MRKEAAEHGREGWLATTAFTGASVTSARRLESCITIGPNLANSSAWTWNPVGMKLRGQRTDNGRWRWESMEPTDEDLFLRGVHHSVVALRADEYYEDLMRRLQALMAASSLSPRERRPQPLQQPRRHVSSGNFGSLWSEINVANASNININVASAVTAAAMTKEPTSVPPSHPRKPPHHTSFPDPKPDLYISSSVV